jgi:hypothetical protein
MRFLTDDDYDVQLRNELAMVLKQTDTTMAKAEGMAQSQMISYFKPRGYDVTAIFSATGDARSPEVIMYLIDMVIYHMHSQTATRVMPQIRHDRYHAALDWLNKIAKTELDPDLPKIDGTNPDPVYRFGGNYKTFNRW